MITRPATLRRGEGPSICINENAKRAKKDGDCLRSTSWGTRKMSSTEDKGGELTARNKGLFLAERPAKTYQTSLMSARARACTERVMQVGDGQGTRRPVRTRRREKWSPINNQMRDESKECRAARERTCETPPSAENQTTPLVRQSQRPEKPLL